MEEHVTAKRTLTYTGPSKWVRSCAVHSVVSLSRELSGGKTITSTWEDPALQSIAASEESKALKSDVYSLLLQQRNDLLAAVRKCAIALSSGPIELEWLLTSCREAIARAEEQ